MKSGRHGLVVNLLVSPGDMTLQQNSLISPAEPPFRKNALGSVVRRREPHLGQPLVPIALSAPEIVLKVVDVLPAQSMIGGANPILIRKRKPQIAKGDLGGLLEAETAQLLIHPRTGTRNAAMLPPRLEAGRLSSPLSRHRSQRGAFGIDDLTWSERVRFATIGECHHLVGTVHQEIRLPVPRTTFSWRRLFGSLHRTCAYPPAGIRFFAVKRAALDAIMHRLHGNAQLGSCLANADSIHHSNPPFSFTHYKG